MSVVSSAVKETATATRVVFANHNLRRVNLALAGSMIGDTAYATAVTVFAFKFGGPTAVGAYVGIRLALKALLLPTLSVIVDRVPRKQFMVATDLIRVVLVLLGTVIIWTSGPALVVLIISIVAAIVGAPFRPAQMALLPSLAETPQELTAGNGISSTLESLAIFIGPALAGVLLSVADVSVVFVLNAATFLWSAVMISRIRVVTEPPQGDPEPGDVVKRAGLLSESVAGFRVLGQDRRLVLITALCCAQTLVTGASTVFTVVVAVDIVKIGPEGVGYLDSVMGIGAIIGGLLAISRAARGTLAGDFGIGVLLWALPPLFVAAVPSPIVAFLAFAVIGLANPLVDVNAFTLIQRLAPEALLGRVFGALESLFIGSMAIGAVLMPLLIGLVGLRWALVIVSLPIVIAVLLRIPALRRMDKSVTPPEHLALINSLPLFAPLTPAIQEGLARNLIPVAVTAGETVIRQGESGDLFYLIESGELDALQGDRVLSHMSAGDCFGEIALLRDVPRTATVIATTDAMLYSLSQDDFLAAVGADPEARSQADGLVNLRLSR